MAKEFSRREFIKIAGAGLGGLAVTGGVGKAVHSALGDDNKEDVITKTATYCEMCTYQCAGWAYLKNGEPWKIVGNDIDEHSYGRLCTKGSAGFGVYDDPDRLKTPLIRKEERGKQVFKEATWDEAFEYIAKKMDDIKKKHGPESVALFSHGSGGSGSNNSLRRTAPAVLPRRHMPTAAAPGKKDTSIPSVNLSTALNVPT